MARPRKPRGRQSPRLPGLRVSDAEYKWVLAEVARIQAEGYDTNLTKVMRNRIFGRMPGYKG